MSADWSLCRPTVDEAADRLARIAAGEHATDVYKFARPTHILALRRDQEVVVADFLKSRCSKKENAPVKKDGKKSGKGGCKGK